VNLTPQRREVSTLGNITVGRYESKDTGYQGWIEPDDKSWIMFVCDDGQPVAFLDRDPATGAVR
jgi:hypothetical protein